MRWFSRFIVNNRVLIFIICLILIAISIFYIPKLKVTYDIYKLIPKDVESIRGMDILNKELSHGAELTILYKTEDPYLVESLVNKLKLFPFIDSISYIKDFQDISIPIELWGEDSKNWYKDGYFKIEIVLKASERYKTQIDSIKSILPEEASLTGNDVITSELSDHFKGSVEKYFLIGVILVLIFLLLTFPRIWGPIFIILSMVSGVIINIGITSFLKIEVYFLVNTIVSILQLAVTLDYSLFLYHRYIEERRESGKELAMENALTKILKPIILSGLTTIGGFYALTFGRLNLFNQAGWILVRGVTISMLCSFIFLPSILLIFDKLVVGKEHKVFPLSLGNIGKYIAKYSYLFFTIFVILLVSSYFGSKKVNLVYDIKNFLPENLESVKTLDKLKEVFGEKDSFYLISKKDNEGFLNTLKEIENLDGVQEVFHYSTIFDPTIPYEFLPKDIINKFVGNDYELSIIYSKYSPNEEEGKILREKIKEIVHKNIKGEVYLTGESLLLSDLRNIAMEDQNKTTNISLYIILFLIAIGFLSILSPIILTLVIKTAIWINIAYYLLINLHTPFFIPTLLNTIQLGATIDYGVLVLSRYEEERKEGLNPIEATNESIKWSSHSILTSAGTMIFMTLPSALFSDIKLVNFTMGSLARGAFISSVITLIFLPAIIKIFDKLIKFLSIGWNKKEV
jgi:predicted RND superfamily exporter protein